MPEEKWKTFETPPIAIIHGQFDKAGNAINAIRFHENIPAKDKTLWYYEKMWNSPLLEQEYPDIENKIVDWMKKRI